MGKRNYHHGDLQESLIRSGMEILSEQGIDALTLRETARRAGVSHSAPYRHFRSKEELIGAIAAEGFRMLTLALTGAVEKGRGDFREELRLSGHAYVDFALSHPEHLKLMFSARRFDFGANCIHGMEDLEAFSQIKGVFSRGLESGVIVSQQPAEALALLVWSQVHGLSHILIEQQIPPNTLPIDSVFSLIDEQVAIICRGLGPRYSPGEGAGEETC